MISKYPALFNFFGLDPFDFGETNLTNGFCRLNKELSNVAKAFYKSAQSPNVYRLHDDKKDVFYVELPGCKKDDISVTVEDDDSISIKAKRKLGEKELTFETQLASDMDTEHAELSYADGILTITVKPKPVVEPERKTLDIQ